MCISKSIGLAYSWKDICASNLQHVFTEARLEHVDLSKTQLCISTLSKSIGSTLGILDGARIRPCVS